MIRPLVVRCPTGCSQTPPSWNRISLLSSLRSYAAIFRCTGLGLARFDGHHGHTV
jgi:hypothetical protein